MDRRGRWLGLLLCLASISGCALRPRPAVAPGGAPVADRSPVADQSIVLNDHSLRLHFARGARGPQRPLLVYATGDGGWHRKDLAAYRHLVSYGYPTVGFDAHQYVTHLGRSGSTTPARLAADYERIIHAAKATLALPAEYPVVLVGVSRGAGLSVAAASQRTLRPLIDHDRAHGGDLLHTLRAFLEEDRVQRRAAARCFVHVNTIVYRVRRIEELLGVDLGDPAAVFDITLALRILDLLGD